MQDLNYDVTLSCEKKKKRIFFKYKFYLPRRRNEIKISFNFTQKYHIEIY